MVVEDESPIQSLVIKCLAIKRMREKGGGSEGNIFITSIVVLHKLNLGLISKGGDSLVRKKGGHCSICKQVLRSGGRDRSAG